MKRKLYECTYKSDKYVLHISGTKNLILHVQRNGCLFRKVQGKNDIRDFLLDFAMLVYVKEAIITESDEKVENELYNFVND